MLEGEIDQFIDGMVAMDAAERLREAGIGNGPAPVRARGGEDDDS